tara:strand:- start:20795 stop:21679 length:885 start_codon:yes stop_codon:yes gene_type:complete
METVAQTTFKELIKIDSVKERFGEILGKGSAAFLVSVLNCVQNNDKLQACEPNSILMAAAVSATLKLPVDPSLGMAYIIPYGKKAQFQIGYKGIIDLCHRSQQFSLINVTPVYEGEFLEVDHLSGEYKFEWNQDQDERKKMKITGYVAFFKLLNGFSKSYYMTDLEVSAHGSKFSKTYNFASGIWKKDRVGMAKKTVLKLLLDKYAPKSVEMGMAFKTDQAVVESWDGEVLAYEDNPQTPLTLEQINEQQECNRAIKHISNAETIEVLEEVYPHIPTTEIRKMYDSKLEILKGK